MLKARNMESYRGNAVKNHFILEGDDEKLFRGLGIR